MKPGGTQTLVGCLLALLIGVALGGFRSFFPSDDAKAAPAPGESRPIALAQPQPVDDALARAVRRETGANRWLLLVGAAEKAKAADMPAIIRAAGEDNAAVRMLAAHWAELDPRHMFQSLYAEYLLPDGAPGALPSRWVLTQVLFEEWTKAEPAAVVKALNDVPNFSGRESLRMTVSSQLMKADVESGLRAMKDWNIRNYIPDMKKLADWAARDPRHAAEVVVEFGREHVAIEALKHVGKAWATSDPKGALRFASGLESTSRAMLGTEVMRNWALKDLDAAVEFASAQTDPAFRNAMAQGLVGTWAQSDPARALEWSQQELRGAARTEAIGGIIKAAAEKDLAAAGELVSGMEAGAAQNRASASLFEVWFNKGKEEREAAFGWLAALPDGEARRAAFERVQWNWMWSKPDEVRDFILGPHGKLASQSMIHQVARNQAARNPEAAMEWAGKLSADRASTARSAVLENWVQIRPEGATAYARKLPAGPERERAVQTVVQHLAWQSPEQAAAFVRSLPSAEQKTASQLLEGIGFTPDQRRRLDAAMKKN